MAVVPLTDTSCQNPDSSRRACARCHMRHTGVCPPPAREGLSAAWSFNNITGADRDRQASANAAAAAVKDEDKPARSFQVTQTTVSGPNRDLVSRTQDVVPANEKAQKAAAAAKQSTAVGGGTNSAAADSRARSIQAEEKFARA
ncbi:MAG: hypothetical protein Q9205_007447, partial [Flavoplaca limonia]